MSDKRTRFGRHRNQDRTDMLRHYCFRCNSLVGNWCTIYAGLSSAVTLICSIWCQWIETRFIVFQDIVKCILIFYYLFDQIGLLQFFFMYKFLLDNSVRTWLSGEWTTWGAGAVVRYSGGCALSCSPELLAGQIILIRATPNRSTCFYQFMEHVDNRRRSRLFGRLVACQLRKIYLSYYNTIGYVA